MLQCIQRDTINGLNLFKKKKFLSRWKIEEIDPFFFKRRFN